MASKVKQGNRNTVSKLSTLINRLTSPGNNVLDAFSMSSGTSHLLWTNDPPSEIERAEIALAISRAEKKKEELEASLGRKISQVTRVRKSVKELDAFIATHKTILSTLRHLPFDVLSYIFTLCLEPIRTQPLVRTHWYNIPSFTLSQVCRGWRSVALETPILWSFLGNVRLNQRSGLKFGYSYVKFLETLLRRSKSLDLWIYVYAPFQQLDTHRAIAPLVRHSDRWRVVTFETTQSVVAAFRGVHHYLPRLQSLSLNLWRGGEKIIFNMFSDTPSLTEVTISGLCPRLDIPWGQLRSFNEPTKAEERTQLAHVFNHSTDSLEHLVVSLRLIVILRIMSNVTGLPTTPVIFPKLKTLRLTYTGDPDDNVGHFFISALTLPCLEDLDIVGCQPPLLHFFRRSFECSKRPPLKRLSLHDVEAPSDIAKILRLVSHLEHFEVGSTVVDVFGEMSEINENGPLLPELRTLIIKLDQWRTDITDKFATLTSSRCKRSTPAEENDPNTTAHTLTEISLIFPSRDPAILLQRYLNNWCGTYDSDPTAWIRRYDSWRGILPSRGTELEVPLWNLNYAAAIDEELAALEKLGPQEANYIYASQLVYASLQAFSLLRKVPDDDKYHFRKRAKAITERWDAIIRADITDVNSRWRKNWVMRGEKTLQYVPDDYVFSDMAEALQMVFGQRPIN